MPKRSLLIQYLVWKDECTKMKCILNVYDVFMEIHHSGIIEVQVHVLELHACERLPEVMTYFAKISGFAVV